ncbi:efflux RND transporter periplasmic adaptor subunit [Desulfolithobacter sp.]
MLSRILFILLVSGWIFPASLNGAVTTCAVRPSFVETRFSGFTRPRTELDIISEVSGRCLSVEADIGQPLPADGLFATIDSLFTRLELSTVRNRIQQNRRQLRYEQQEVERYTSLVASQTSARSLLDAAVLRRDQVRLALEGLETEKQRLEELLVRHRVLGPPGYLIMDRHVEPGQWVATGQSLARAGDFRTLIVPLAVTYTELQALEQMKTIPVSLPELNLRGAATLYRISPGFDPLTRKTKIELALNRETMARLPARRGGLRVEIALRLPDPLGGLLVPAPAVEERYEEHWLTRPDQTRIRIIVLGPVPDDHSGTPMVRVASPELHVGDHIVCPEPAEKTPRDR